MKLGPPYVPVYDESMQNSYSEQNFTIEGRGTKTIFTPFNYFEIVKKVGSSRVGCVFGDNSLETEISSVRRALSFPFVMRRVKVINLGVAPVELTLALGIGMLNSNAPHPPYVESQITKTSVSTTAVLISSASLDKPFKKVYAGVSGLFVGPVGVTPTTGFPISGRSVLELSWSEDLYGVRSSGTDNAVIMEQNYY